MINKPFVISSSASSVWPLHSLSPTKLSPRFPTAYSCALSSKRLSPPTLPPSLCHTLSLTPHTLSHTQFAYYHGARSVIKSTASPIAGSFSSSAPRPARACSHSKVSRWGNVHTPPSRAQGPSLATRRIFFKLKSHTNTAPSLSWSDL